MPSTRAKTGAQVAKIRRRGETVGSLRPAKKPTCAVRGVNVSHVCTSRQRGMPPFALSIDERPRQANDRILAPFPRPSAGCLLLSSREKTQKGSTPPQFGEAPSLISFQKTLPVVAANLHPGQKRILVCHVRLCSHTNANL